MKGSPLMKNLTKSLTHFTLFSAAACAILFGLPALATRHPFILLAVSLPVLIQWLTPKRQSTAPPPTAKRPDPIIPS